MKRLKKGRAKRAKAKMATAARVRLAQRFIDTLCRIEVPAPVKARKERKP